MNNSIITSLLRLYPIDRGRDRILRLVKSSGAFEHIVPQPPNPAILTNGQRLDVFGGEYMSDYIRLWGKFESKTEGFICSHLQSGACFVDAGANFGYFTMVACHASPGCKVVAIEPNPLIAEALRRSAKLNGNDSRVTVLEMAISDEPGTLPLMCQSENSGLAHLGSSERRDGDTARVLAEVKVEVWDDWMTSAGFSEKTSILKMDIEGAEMKALTGMKSWIAKNTPAIVVEANDENLKRFGSTRAELEEFMFELGYAHQLPPDNNFYLVHRNRQS